MRERGSNRLRRESSDSVQDQIGFGISPRDVLGADIPDLFPVGSPQLLRHLYLSVARLTGQVRNATVRGAPSLWESDPRYFLPKFDIPLGVVVTRDLLAF